MRYDFQVDKELKKYRNTLGKRYKIPKFAKEAVHTAPILALLQDPGNSGAKKTEVCSIHTNKDATSRNQKEAIKEAGIDTKDIVFWNFFAPFNIGKNFGIESQETWAKEVEELIRRMPKLKVVLVCGEKAWKGMRFVKLKKSITLIAAPHPSSRGLAQLKARDKLEEAWKRAKEMAGLE